MQSFRRFDRATYLLIGLIVWFSSLEARGNRHVIFLVFVITLLVEGLLAGPSSEVPIGILRPRIAGQDFRPPDAIIVAAVFVRIFNLRGQRLQRPTLWWSAFLTVYIAGALVGLLRSLPTVDVLFQGKVAFYIIGAVVIGSGVDLRRLASSAAKVGLVLACLVPIAFMVKSSRLEINVSTPMQDFRRLGRVSNDSISLITFVAVVVIMAEIVRRKRRIWVGFAILAMLAAPTVGLQRASYMVVGVIAMCFAVLIAGSTWRRRSRATILEIGLFGVGVFGLVVGGVAVTSAPGVLAPVQQAFGGDADATSARARVSLYDQSIDKIAEQPLIGAGVGTKVTRIIERGNREVGATAHNIVLDMTMRVGLFGLVLFVAAIGSTMATGLRVWRRSRDDVIAAMSMAAILVMVGVLAKAMVEPALDRFRLSSALGLAIGIVLAAQREDERLDAEADEIERSDSEDDGDDHQPRVEVQGNAARRAQRDAL